MADINGFNLPDYSSFFGTTNNTNNSYSLADWSTIKNGTYRKLMKAYYKNDDEQSKAEAAEETKQTNVKIKSQVDTLKKTASALMDKSLWEKKTLTKKDEKTGETTEYEDYDWEKITKAVKSFVDAYNDTLDESVESDNKKVLRNTVYMTQSAKSIENLLEDVGITIDEDNKLSVDEEKLKKANMADLKTLFVGKNSFADKVMQKASAINNAVSNSDAIYTKDAAYSETLAKLVSGKVDEEV